jgi:DNA-binding IclR family transcriptional regulator
MDGRAAVSRVRSAESQLRRGLRVLEELAARPGTAAELARELGVNRSTALRLLNELEDAGYVVRDSDTKRYSAIVERLYALVASHDDHWDWVELIAPTLASLRDEFAEAVVHAVPANGSMVYMAFFPSLHPIAVRERVGTVRPMHCSGLGKAYLSALDQRSLDIELGRLSYEGGTPHAAKGPIELRQRVAEARERGYAVDWEETFDGVVCVAAPTTVGGALVGAAGVSGPASRLSEGRVEEIAVRLVKRLATLDRGV